MFVRLNDYGPLLTASPPSTEFHQTPTCFHMGSKFHCIRSTPSEIASSNENAFECFAKTGDYTPRSERRILSAKRWTRIRPLFRH